MSKQPNPQGKGLTPLLSDWQRFTPRLQTGKSSGQWFADYFTSLLVLSADFRFKPVVGQHYYLYLNDQRWQLSLIEPDRWGDRKPGYCLGRCELHSDMTWSITPLDAIEDGYSSRVDCPEDSNALAEALHIFIQHLVNHWDSYESLDESLPFYSEQLPYYRRLAANGLARSISSNVKAISFKQWRSNLALATTSHPFHWLASERSPGE